MKQNIDTIVRKTKYYLNTCPKCRERLSTFRWHDSKECNSCGYYRHWNERYWTKQQFKTFYLKNRARIEKRWEAPLCASLITPGVRRRSIRKGTHKAGTKGKTGRRLMKGTKYLRKRK